MQSYLDLSLLLLIGIAVVLLVIVLSSFLICQRQISRVEKSLEEFKSDHVEELKQQSTTMNQSLSQLKALARRVAVSEQSSRYLTDNQQQFLDKQDELIRRLEALQAEISGLKTRVEELSARNEPVSDAVALLRRGLNVDEVAEKTTMSKNEVELLKAVHGIEDPEAADPQPQPRDPAERRPPRAPVAGLKARDAYGIPSRGGSLRRLR